MELQRSAGIGHKPLPYTAGIHPSLLIKIKYFRSVIDSGRFSESSVCAHACVCVCEKFYFIDSHY